MLTLAVQYAVLVVWSWALCACTRATSEPDAGGQKDFDVLSHRCPDKLGLVGLMLLQVAALFPVHAGLDLLKLALAG